LESSNHEYGTTLLIALLLSFGLPAIGGPITSPAASLLPYGAALLALAAIAATLAVRLAVRKRALALEIERLALAAAIEQSGESIVICDPAGTIQHVSAAFTRMTGYTSEEVIGRTPRMLKSGRQDPAFYRELWSTITAGKTWRGRLVNRRKDGACYTEEMTITPVRDTNGMTVAYTAIKRDVTNGRTGESARQVPGRARGFVGRRHRQPHSGRRDPELEPRSGDAVWISRGRGCRQRCHHADAPGGTV
jgi:PAS domain S-box-containing protein